MPKNWLHVALTDDHGQFDVAQIMVPVASLAMIALDAYAVIVRGQAFDAAQLGTGIAAVIGALGVYKWGDKRPASTLPAAKGEGA